MSTHTNTTTHAHTHTQYILYPKCDDDDKTDAGDGHGRSSHTQLYNETSDINAISYSAYGMAVGIIFLGYCVWSEIRINVGKFAWWRHIQSAKIRSSNRSTDWDIICLVISHMVRFVYVIVNGLREWRWLFSMLSPSAIVTVSNPSTDGPIFINVKTRRTGCRFRASNRLRSVGKPSRTVCICVYLFVFVRYIPFSTHTDASHIWIIIVIIIISLVFHGQLRLRGQSSAHLSLAWLWACGWRWGRWMSGWWWWFWWWWWSYL